MSTKRTCHLALGLMLSLWAFGCQETNPAYLGHPRDASLRNDATILGGEPDSPGTPDSLPPEPDGNPDGDPDGNSDLKRQPDLARLDQATDALPVVPDGGDLFDSGPSDARDSRDVRGSDEPTVKDFGAEPGIAPDVPHEAGPEVPYEVGTDAVDAPSSDGPLEADTPVGDDAALDLGGAFDVAVDSSPGCPEGTTEICARPGNPLVGACRTGEHTCTGGVWSPCSDVMPAAEECNGLDDNCNGAIDEGCVNDCIAVCQSCGDASADGSTGQPFTTIEAAIATVGQVDGGSRTRICVAGGTSCSEAATYQIHGPLNITDGAIVQGGYALTATGLVYCDVTSQPKTTIEFMDLDQGVEFQQGVGSAELSGFVIKRFSDQGGVGTSNPDIAGVVVDGGKNVSLSRIFITDEPTGASTYGVRITSGGQSTIIGSSINVGQGTSAIGVYVSGGSVDLRNNCDVLVAGTCTSVCSDAGAVLGIRGRATTDTPDGGAESWAVVIGNADTAASTLVGNMLCGGVSEGGVPSAGAPSLGCAGAGCPR